MSFDLQCWWLTGVKLCLCTNIAHKGRENHYHTFKSVPGWFGEMLPRFFFYIWSKPIMWILKAWSLDYPHPCRLSRNESSHTLGSVGMTLQCQWSKHTRIGENCNLSWCYLCTYALWKNWDLGRISVFLQMTGDRGKSPIEWVPRTIMISQIMELGYN